MKRWLAPALSLLLPVTIALADGDGPVRKTTGLEAPPNYGFAFSDGSGPGEPTLPERAG